MPTLEEFESWRTRLRQEIVGLHDAREQYLILFGHSAARVEMLNACAAWFFGLVQRVLLREIILAVSRITDREESLGKSNLVLASLLADPMLADDAGLARELREAIQSAIDAAEPIRVHRHKYIAHLDHAVAIDSPEATIPPLLKADIDGAVAKIEDAYNLHGLRTRQTHAMFSVSTTRGADALVDILEGSERWTRLRDRGGQA